MTTLNDAVKAINEWVETVGLLAEAMKKVSDRVAELDRRVKELEARPAQQVHNHYITQPLQLGQPHWPPGTILCSNGNVGAWHGAGVVGIKQ